MQASTLKIILFADNRIEMRLEAPFPARLREEEEALMLRLIIVTVTLVVVLFAGSGVASAGMAWCDWGSPPPMEVGIASNPQNNPHGMPTPLYKNSNGKFTPNPLAGTPGGPPAGSVVPPGMTAATISE